MRGVRANHESGWIEAIGLLWVGIMMIMVLNIWDEWILFQQSWHRHQVIQELLHTLEQVSPIILMQIHQPTQDQTGRIEVDKVFYLYSYKSIGLYPCIHRFVHKKIFSTWHGWFEVWRSDRKQYSLKFRVAWPYDFESCESGQYRQVDSLIISWNFVYHENTDLKRVFN